MAVNTIRQVLNTLYPLGTGEGKVIVAGMPKSGTTAIAALLAASIGDPLITTPLTLAFVRPFLSQARREFEKNKGA